jgi:adenylate cyclase
MTLMFCDVRGFTTLSERFAEDPQGLVHVMNRLFSALTAVILKHGGTVDKYIGDCVMAFWNAPLAVPDHAARACAAALEMITAVNRLNAEFAAETAMAGSPVPKLDIGIGINTGSCVVGNIGAEQRFDYSVLGDPVNLASRLEGQSKNYGTRIVVGPETATMAADFAFLELDLIAVKGKTRAMHVYALMGGPETRKGESFNRLLERHHRLLERYRKQEWAAARTVLAECRELAPDLSRLYDLYGRRIDRYEADPPEEAWGGVYAADTK